MVYLLYLVRTIWDNLAHNPPLCESFNLVFKNFI